MNAQLLTEADLKEWLGIERRSALERRLREIGAKIVYGKDGQVCTTVAAINAALGVRVSTQTNDIEFGHAPKK